MSVHLAVQFKKKEDHPFSSLRSEVQGPQVHKFQRQKVKVQGLNIRAKNKRFEV